MDPLLCPQCQVEVQVVSVIQEVPVIQEVAVIDRLLAHLRKIGGNGSSGPHDGTAQRGPPSGGARASPDEDG